MFTDFDHKKLSLNDCACDYQGVHNDSISKVALHKRFTTQAVDFLKLVLKSLFVDHTRKYLKDTGNWKHFNRVRIKDSTKFSIPDRYSDSFPSYGGVHKNKSLMNIQYEYDLKTGDYIDLDLTSARRNDQQDSRESISSIEKNDLLIRDLGYCTMPFIKGVISKGAYFVNRLPANTNVYIQKDNTFHLFEWKKVLGKIKKNRLTSYEQEVYLSRKDKVPVRIVIMPLPQEAYQKRLKKITFSASSKKYNVSDESKIKCAYNIYITNLDNSQLSEEQIRTVYSIRWQIELVFKTWKSYLSLDQVKAVKIERFLCHLLAKFIWILVNWKLFHYFDYFLYKKPISKGKKSRCSMFKFIKQAKKYSHTLCLALTKPNCRLKNWIEHVIILNQDKLILEVKKGQLDPFNSFFNDLG